MSIPVPNPFECEGRKNITPPPPKFFNAKAACLKNIKNSRRKTESIFILIDEPLSSFSLRANLPKTQNHFYTTIAKKKKKILPLIPSELPPPPKGLASLRMGYILFLTRLGMHPRFGALRVECWIGYKAVKVKYSGVCIATPVVTMQFLAWCIRVGAYQESCCPRPRGDRLDAWFSFYTTDT